MKSTCTILSVTKDNLGLYQCKAINDVTEVSTKAKLDLTSGAAVVAASAEPEKETKAKVVEKPKAKAKVKAKRSTPAKEILSVGSHLEAANRTEVSIEELSESSKKVVSSSTVLVEDSLERAGKTEIFIEEVNESSAKMSSTSSVQVMTTRKHIEEDDIEIIEETEAVHVKIYKEAYSQEEIDNFKVADEVNVILDAICAEKYGSGEPPLRELATIGFLLKKGISIYEILQLYNADFFPALKIPESQSALVQLVERQGHEQLIAEVLNNEADEDETLLASTVGFRAFMRMVELTHCMVEDLLTNFKFDDFVAQEWKYKEIREDSSIDVTETHISSIKSESSSNGK